MSALPPSLAELVAANSLFRSLPARARPDVVECLRPQRVDDGTYLFHSEQRADRLYLVVEGELEVLRMGHGEVERLNVVGVGDLVGELALLRGSVRSASVRARGRVLVYWMHAADFTRLVHRWPSLAIEVARRVASTFVSSERRWQGLARVQTWCIHESLPREFVDALVSAATRYLDLTEARRIVVETRQPRPPRELAGFSIVERAPAPSQPDQVDGPADEPGTALVLVHGSRSELQASLPHCDAMLVADGTPSMELPVSARRMVITRRGIPTRDRVKPRPGAAVSSVAPRVVRILLGKSVGLALGGGGALGFAHLGVIEVLEQMGLEADYVLGTSMGAVIGGAYLGLGATELRRRVERMSRPRDWMALVDPSVVTSGVLSGNRALRFLEGLLELERFDQLHTPFAAVALDIDAAEERVLEEGSLPNAVRASMSIPGVIMPHRYDSPFGSVRYVDGCMINNVPVDSVRAMGADRVIGVHVISRELGTPKTRRPGRRWSPRLPGLSSLSRLTNAAQTYVVALARSGERQVYMADVGILPDTAGIALWEMWRGCEIADLGAKAALDARERLEVLSGRTAAR